MGLIPKETLQGYRDLGKKKLVKYWLGLVQELVRQIEIVQRLLGLEKIIVIFSYFLTNAIYR